MFDIVVVLPVVRLARCAAQEMRSAGSQPDSLVSEEAAVTGKEPHVDVSCMTGSVSKEDVSIIL